MSENQTGGPWEPQPSPVPPHQQSSGPDDAFPTPVGAQPVPAGQSYPSGPGYAYPSAPAASQSAPVPAVPGVELGSWGRRVGGYLVDVLVAGIPLAIGEGIFVGGSLSDALNGTTSEVSAGGAAALIVGGLITLVLWAWNRGVLQGRSGRSIGKRAVGLRLIGERTHQPIGVGMALVRDILHVLDSFLYVGYLWPLWDPKKQTFADKILSTLSVRG
ncbi:RDD family protein [Isoptericola sp. b441]|uniref:RDD family protein n=1 Tax=Actinotalea lenta TaxID=3064654 RepID=A0ABT9D5X7_9CELL|nr:MULTISPECIES: RDD family protein [unclassified Isoptericola]MDO8106219.1 RDD family protein [Isoptericola sp. b441]MDO8122061.1 RDD family protein [Isoptericola sp. b490]